MKISPVKAGLIDLVMEEEGYSVYYEHKPLMTAGGNMIRSSNQRVLKQLIIESCLMDAVTDEKICVFSLQSVCNDFLVNGRDPFLDSFEEHCGWDPFIQLRQGRITTGDISRDGNLSALPESDPVLFNMLFWGISGALEAFSIFSMDYRDKLLSGKKVTDWSGFVGSVYSGLPDYQKAVINLLSFTHHSGVALPVLLACGYINGMEYVNGLSAISLRNKEITGRSPFTVPVYADSGKGFLTDVPGILEDVRNAVGFLVSFNTLKLKGIEGIIGKGEGQDLEFKSTLRWDLKAGKTSQHIERACLKTISAFLNSNGGLLLIGVRDDGSVEGVESDRFPNTDKFLLHLWTLIRTSFGTDISPNISAQLEILEGKTVCSVKCQRSGRPVFLKQPGFEEEFYIRVGPGTVALAVSEALKYISDHFTDK